MAIPNSIIDFRSGIAGTLSHDGPTRAQPGLIDTADEDNNVFGRAFTRNVDGTFAAGGIGPFVGILIHPHAYAIGQSAARNGTSGEFVHMGEIFATVSGSPEAYAKVYFVPATGELTTESEDNTEILNALIVRHDPDQNLCVVSLTGLVGAPTIPENGNGDNGDNGDNG